MTISAFSVIKNEVQFIGYGLMSILPYVDQVVYFDGNSTDGTLELLSYIQGMYDPYGKIKVYKNRDFKDFKEDYVKTFNDCMKECKGDYLWYVHPDMILTDPGKLVDREKWSFKAASVGMRSFGGEEMELEIVKGRTGTWKTIMKNDFGLHYWGFYGHPDEDMYFKDITGNSHVVQQNMRLYPYRVEDLGIKMWHMCECKPRIRREEKMRNVLRTISPSTVDDDKIADAAMYHPRVHLKTENGAFGNFVFQTRKDPLPDVFEKYKEEFERIVGRRNEGIGSLVGT